MGRGRRDPVSSPAVEQFGHQGVDPGGDPVPGQRIADAPPGAGEMLALLERNFGGDALGPPGGGGRRGGGKEAAS